MKYLCIILLFVSFSTLSASAQYATPEDTISKNIVNDALTDSIVSNGFSSSFYFSKNVLERNYDYELFNKKRKLLMWSNEVRVLGYASMLGVIGLGSWLAADGNWSLWITIPVEVIIGGGICYGANVWANNLKKKADAIQESSISIMEINHRSNLYITHYSINGNNNLGFGVGYKYNF